MAGLTCKTVPEQRPALLRDYEYEPVGRGIDYSRRFTGRYTKCLVFTNLFVDGKFVIEYEDGRLGMAKYCELRFVDSSERFDLYNWEVPE